MNVVIQLFNKIKNGNLVAGDVVNSTESKLLKEIKLIIDKNFRDRIKNHKQIYIKSQKMQQSNNIWWLDETDYFFEEGFTKIQEMNAKLDEYLYQLKSLSPYLHNECKDFLELDYNVFKLMETSRVRNIDVENYTIIFPSSYSVLIKELEDSCNKIMNDFDNSYSI